MFVTLTLGLPEWFSLFYLFFFFFGGGGGGGEWGGGGEMSFHRIWDLFYVILSKIFFDLNA